ncbi:Endonuclease/Exonuclease/phosphatase family protein [Acanthocheilonema viteae]
MKFLLITANVGSLFEESSRIHNAWLATFTQIIKESNAHFIAIHMQEVGGKNSEECIGQVPAFLDHIAASMHEMGYSTGRAYLDLEFDLPESYNALGSLFFINDVTLPRIRQYDFMTKEFVTLEKVFESYDRGLLKCRMLRKAKFPKDFWPTVKWSRKGYMHCRFRIDQTVFDFVNVHLFHDESNIALIHENPALYSENRKRALNFVLKELKRVNEDENYSYPLFLFGDLNFRLDLQSFLNRITDDTDLREDSTESAQSSICNTDGCGDLLTPGSPHTNELKPLTSFRRTVSAIEFRRSPDNFTSDIPTSCVLRIEKKLFDYFNHKRLLNEWQGYLEDDREVHNFPYLRELSINFPPTYPWSENPDESESLMKTRAPAWCDRVLMNARALEMVKRDEFAKYDSFGKDVCMGDHKPVMLSFSVIL